MEIKHSSPQSARPVEMHSGKKRWPWIVLIVIGVLLVIAAIVAALYFYGGTLLRRDQAPSDTQTNQTDQTPPSTPSGFSVNSQPNEDELTNLVVGRFADAGSIGPITLFTVDATDTGTLRETRVLTLDAQKDDALTRAVVSPNGQFVAVSETELFDPREATAPRPPTTVVSLVELSSGEATTIADDLAEPAEKPVWTPDSAFVIFGDSDPDAQEPQQLYVYDVESGETSTVTPSDDPLDLFIPVSATDDDLFVIQTTVASENPGTLGTLGLRDGELSDDFEQIIDMPAQTLGLDISSDGREIVLASGGGDELSEAIGPFVLELLDRSTGEIEELRRSSSEQYSAPRFTPDGERIVYGAASGVWMLDRDSEERIQLIESTEFELLDGIARPRFVSPDGEFVVVSTASGTDVVETFYVIPLDSELATFEDIGQVEPDEDITVDVFGWTI